MEGEGEGEAYRPYIVPDEIGTRFPRERTDPLVLQGVLPCERRNRRHNGITSTTPDAIGRGKFPRTSEIGPCEEIVVTGITIVPMRDCRGRS